MALSDPPVFCLFHTYKITDFSGSVELYFLALTRRTLNYNLLWFVRICGQEDIDLDTLHYII
jgi:hypothetical protein